MRTVIGIPVTQDIDLADTAYPKLRLNCDYARAVAAAGGLPLLLPVTGDANESIVAQWLTMCDGIL
ncbi:MAG: gamma-glutamyl-gamma-aminobutyrate hydrolase family protein, partial [Ruthenibacterium sp.]